MKKSLISSEEKFLCIVGLLIFGFAIGARIGQAIWDTYLG